MEEKKLTREQVIGQVQKLIALANCSGAFTAEAETAMLKAKALMAKYNVSLFDTQTKKFNDKVVEITFETPFETNERIPAWYRRFFGCIAKAYEVIELGGVEQNGYHAYKMFGFPTDIQAFLMLYSLASVLLLADAHKKAKEAGRKGAKQVGNFIDNFMISAGIEIAKKIGNVETSPEANAIVPIKKQEVENFIKSKYDVSSSRHTGYRPDSSAWASGADAGRRFGQGKVTGGYKAITA